jgi:carboxypeptidase Taq
MKENQDLKSLREADREIQLLTHAIALLEWDQETYMPDDALTERAEQIALLKGLLHDRVSSPQVGELLACLGATDDNPGGTETSNVSDTALVRELVRIHSRAVRLPKNFVIKLARQIGLSQSAWAKARDASDFSLFAPFLEDLLALIRSKADYLGYTEHPYDALLDEYEPWMLTGKTRTILSSLRDPLAEVLDRIRGSERDIDASFLIRDFAEEKQRRFSHLLLKAMGFDFRRGRLDESAHPFATTLGAQDIRLTTRYHRNLLSSALFGSIHEAGHGLYESGFADELKGSILANGTSLGIHESQSRMWENLIGRSRPFWLFFYPELQRVFPEALSDVRLDAFFHGINKVEASHIRIEADEVTYNLHIILRFNIELKLIEREIEVKDLPEAWRQESEESLGITPEDDAEGVLQDIHWSFGSFGYFPTYALGNLYAAQFFSKMKADIGTLDEELAKGNLDVPLDWLRRNIHCHGSIYPADELCRMVTGHDLDPAFFISYLNEKFRKIYEF